MGYRSEVTALIYGPKAKMDALIMKERHTGQHVFGNILGPHIREWDEPADADSGAMKGLSYVMLTGEDWKWYDGYEDVDAFMTFMRSAPEFGCAYEFARIGEESNDIEIERGEPEETDGQDQLYLIDVNSAITSQVGPPYDPSEDTTVPDYMRPSEPQTYWGASTVETALCLWEAFLEFDGQGEPLVKKLRAEDGTPAARHVVMGWAHECEEAWVKARADGTETEPFDWEHCPNFLMRKLNQRFVGQGERS